MSGNEHIELDVATLLAQSASMKSLKEEYNGLFTKVTSILGEMNNGWSENLANNFVGKISAAQKGFAKIVEMLECGENVAKEAATSFEDVNNIMARQISGTFAGLFEGSAIATIADMIHTGINPDMLKEVWKNSPYADIIPDDLFENIKDGNFLDILKDMEGEAFGTDYISKAEDGIGLFKDLINGNLDSGTIDKISNLVDITAITDYIGFSDGTPAGIIVKGMKDFVDPNNPITQDYADKMQTVYDNWDSGNYLEAITGGFFYSMEASTKTVVDVGLDTLDNVIDTAMESTGLDKVIDVIPWDNINDKMTEATGIDWSNFPSELGKNMSEEFSNRVQDTVEGIPIVVDYVGEQINNGVEYVGDLFEGAGDALAGLFGF